MVPFMNQTEDFPLWSNSEVQAVCIPYRGGHLIPYKGRQLSMVILLPKVVNGLNKLEKQLSPCRLQRWMAELSKSPIQKVEIKLPKFKLETDWDLIPACKNLGIEDAFGTSADFTGMGGRKGEFWISKIQHKALVEVDEEGTRAAATTAVEVHTYGCKGDCYPVFRADHPFLFLIKDNQTGTILFMGRMLDPRGNKS
jgi:serpin B